MTQTEIEKAKRVLNALSGKQPFLYITISEDEKVISVKKGASEDIAEAIFTAIVANSEKDGVATEMFRIVKDVMLNLFNADDKYRRDFVSEMMKFTATNKTSN